MATNFLTSTKDGEADFKNKNTRFILVLLKIFL